MLLIMNGHSTHDVGGICADNNIRVMKLPPHLTHMLQPLDVGVFNIYKAAIRNKSTAYAVQWIDEIPDLPEATRKRCIAIGKSLVAYRQAVTPQNIRKSFYKTGIYPPSMYTFLHFAEGLREVPNDVLDTAHTVVNERREGLHQSISGSRRYSIERRLRMVHGGMVGLG
jgi:hypothetical protein